jgi:VanZ family protein
MTRSKSKFRRDLAWPCLLAGTLTLCSGYQAAVPDIIDIDKFGHFGAYGALATAIVRIPELKRWRGLGCWWALVLASAYGMGDEFRQSLTHGIRTPDWHDWLADTIGAITAVSLYVLWPWYHRVMEWPVLKKRAKPRVEISPEPLPNLPT